MMMRRHHVVWGGFVDGRRLMKWSRWGFVNRRREYCMLGRRIFDGLWGRSVNRGRILDVLGWRFMYQMIVMIFVLRTMMLVLLMRFMFRRRIFVHRRKRVSSATVSSKLVDLVRMNCHDDGFYCVFNE
jgi:hypothetical protein